MNSGAGPRPAPPVPPPLPVSSSTIEPEEVPQYLRNYPFELPARIAHLAPQECSQKSSGFKMLMDYGEKAEHHISLELQIASLIQLGPSCGITAALMLVSDINAENIIGKTNEIVINSRKLGYTMFGEMFNAYHLCDIIQQQMSLPARVLDRFTEQFSTVFRHLLDSKPILIPYDYSSQLTEPGFNDGTKAHWALLIGFCYNFDTFPANIDRDLEERFRSKNLSTKDVLSLIVEKEKLFLYGRHSKTNRICLWRYRDLCHSNSGLKAVANKFQGPETLFKIPPNGHLDKCLAGRCILIDKQFPSIFDYS